MAGDSKTEKATPKRRRDERKKGNVLMSKDALAVATLLGSLAMVMVMGDVVLEQVSALFMRTFQNIAVVDAEMFPGMLSELFKTGVLALITMAGPFLGVTALLAVSVTFFQTKMLVTGESIRPKFSRINPLQGFKRLFSLRSIVEAFKNLLKIIILMFIIVNYFRRVALGFSRFLDMDLSQSCAILFNEIVTLVFQIAIAFTMLAFFDYLYPQVKGKIKQIQRQRAQQRMMQQVPQADVVIRNPTHFAVALRYKPEEDNAPVVLAKGMDELALRIVRIAEESQVSVVENVPLARALYANVDLGREIPPELYGPVAEILVYVLKLDQEVP